MFDLNDDTEFILGMPNFQCGSLARGLRLIGEAIPNKAEKEQAYVIHFLLRLYEEHGSKWREVLTARMKEAQTDEQSEVKTMSELEQESDDGFVNDELKK